MTTVFRNWKVNIRWKENVKGKKDGFSWKGSCTGGSGMIEIRGGMT